MRSSGGLIRFHPPLPDQKNMEQQNDQSTIVFFPDHVFDPSLGIYHRSPLQRNNCPAMNHFQRLERSTPLHLSLLPALSPLRYSAQDHCAAGTGIRAGCVWQRRLTAPLFNYVNSNRENGWKWELTQKNWISICSIGVPFADQPGSVGRRILRIKRKPGGHGSPWRHWFDRSIAIWRFP